MIKSDAHLALLPKESMNQDEDEADPPPDAGAPPRPVTLLINTRSRRGKEEFDQAVAAVKNAGISLAEAIAVEDEDKTKALLQREIEAGARLVIVGGGDGTLSHCAGILVHTDVALAVLPLGTGNTLARSLGIPLDLEGAARSIAEGHIEGMDVGRDNGRVFVNSVTLGLSAEIAHGLDKKTKQRLGLLAWPVVGAKVLWQHRPLSLRVTAAEKSFRARTHQLVISNGRYIAGSVAAAPDASVQDSCLRVFVLGGASKREVLRTAWALLRGRHVDDKEARYFATQKVRVESLRRPVKADVDGEINERTPLELEVLPRALRVVVPRGFEAEEV